MGLAVGCIGIITPLKFLGLSRRGAVRLTLSTLAASFVLSMCALYTTSKMYPDRPQQATVHVAPSRPVTPALTSRALNTVPDFEHSEFCRRYACREDRHWIVRNGDTNHSYDTNLEGVDVEVQDNPSRQPPLTGLGISFNYREDERLSPQDFEVIETLVRCTDQSSDHAKTMDYIRKNIEIDINCRTCSMFDSSNFVTDGDFHVWAKKVDQQQVGWKRLSK